MLFQFFEGYLIQLFVEMPSSPAAAKQLNLQGDSESMQYHQFENEDEFVDVAPSNK